MTDTIIPPEALALHTAALGMTGSGKTTTAKLAIEQVVGQGARVCILDPIKSDWWGLTVNAAGTGPGLPFDILGGPRGHVPLHSSAGAAIGELVANGALRLSIVDMAMFEPGGHAKFFIAFADALLKHMRGVLYLVLEEAHLFAPKERSGIGAETMAVHWAKTLATAGRSKGVRLVLVTQRVQALHNALLGSCGTLIAHQLAYPADQEPVLKWLKAHVPPVVNEEVAASMASLPTGTAWLCCGNAKIFERRAFPRNATYDNTATPTEETDHDRVKTTPVDQAKLRAIIGAAIEEAAEKDPAELRKRIVELERKLSAKPAVAADVERLQARIAELETELAAARAALVRRQTAIDGALGFLMPSEIAHAEGLSAPPPAPLVVPVKPPLPIRPLAAPRPRATPKADGSMHAAARALLAALAQHAPARFTWQQVATLAGLKARGGHYNAGRQELIARGLVTTDGDLVGADKMGVELIGPVPEKPSTPREIVEMWAGRLPAPAPEMLRYIASKGGRAVPREELATALGKQPRGGHWNSGIAVLRNNSLILDGRDGLRPAELLLPR